MKQLLVTVALCFSSFAFGDTCFDANRVRSWSYDGVQNVISVETFGATYDLETSPCFELPWAEAIGFKTFFGSQVCRGDSVILFDGFNKAIDECHISQITQK